MRSRNKCPGRIKETYVLIRAGIEKKQCYTGDDDHILTVAAGSSQKEKERRASSCWTSNITQPQITRENPILTSLYKSTYIYSLWSTLTYTPSGHDVLSHVYIGSL